MAAVKTVSRVNAATHKDQSGLKRSQHIDNVLLLRGRRGKPTEPRPLCKRGKLLARLRKGPVEEKVAARNFNWKRHDVIDAARILAKVNGIPVKIQNNTLSLVK